MSYYKLNLTGKEELVYIPEGSPEGSSVGMVAATAAEVSAHLASQAESAKPKEVTMRQARLALLATGLLSSVDSAVAAITGTAGDAARIEWEYSNSLSRTQPLVGQLAAGLGLAEAQIDALFLTASTL